MDFTAVDDYLIWTEEGRVNTAALDLGTTVVVIDAMRKREHAVKWRTSAENHFNQSIGAVLLTHHHSDHTMGVSVSFRAIWSTQATACTQIFINFDNLPHHWITHFPDW